MTLQVWGASCLLVGGPQADAPVQAAICSAGCTLSVKEAEGVLHGGALHSPGLSSKLASAIGTLPAFPGVPGQKGDGPEGVMLPTCRLSCWSAEAVGWQVQAVAGLSME